MKTSLTMNIGYHLKQRKQSVLLVDLDPQASLTAFMGLEPADLEQTIANAILKDEPIPIHRDIHGMDLAPSNIMLSAAEIQLSSMMSREWRLSKALESVKAEYDFILIDAPPSLGVLSVLSLVAATHVLIPVQTQYKSYKGTELLLDTIQQVKSNVRPDLRIAGIVPTIYAANNAQDKDILSAIQSQLSQVGMVHPPVPRATAFADASMEHLPLALFSRKHAATKVLDDIAKSLVEDLDD